MKTLLTTLIAAMALTQAVQAHDWTWFHGDIGLSSPFVSSPQSTSGITRVVNKQNVNKQKSAPKRAIVGSKTKPLSHRITAR